MRSTILIVTLLLEITGCDTRPLETREAATPSVRLPIIRQNSGHLLFSWFEEGKARTATVITDIPEAFRGEVRVQDPTIPPESRDPDSVFLADLRSPSANGTFRVHVEKRAEYEARLSPAARTPQTPDTSTTPGASQGRVIMYATTHCPYCHKARRWLLEQKIPYDEVDIEKDEAAATSLEKKGRAQGVAIGGVPMFEVNGRLLPGFDPDAILRALSSNGKAAASSPAPGTPSSIVI